MRKAAVYLRVSTRGQQDSGYGLESQRQRCKDYASENELEVVTTVTEARSAGVRDGEVLSWEGRPILAGPGGTSGEQLLPRLVGIER